MHASQAVPLPDGIVPASACLIACAVMTGLGAVENTARRGGGRLGGRDRRRRRRAERASGRRDRGRGSGDRRSTSRPASCAAAPQLRRHTHHRRHRERSGGGGAGADRRRRGCGDLDGRQLVGGGARARLRSPRRHRWWSSACLPADTLRASIRGRSHMTGKRILGSKLGSSRPHESVPRIAALYSAGALRLDELVTATYPLDRINEAIAAMQRWQRDPKRHGALTGADRPRIETLANEWVGVRARPHRRRRARAGARSRPTTPTSPRRCCTGRSRRTLLGTDRGRLRRAGHGACWRPSTSSPARTSAARSAGVDTALWDLRGQAGRQAGLRAGRRRRRGRSRVYASSMRRDIDPADEAGRLADLRSRHGFDAFKIRVGRECGHDRDEWPGRTEALVPAVRRALGDEARAARRRQQLLHAGPGDRGRPPARGARRRPLRGALPVLGARVDRGGGARRSTSTSPGGEQDCFLLAVAADGRAAGGRRRAAGRLLRGRPHPRARGRGDGGRGRPAVRTPLRQPVAGHRFTPAPDVRHPKRRALRRALDRGAGATTRGRTASTIHPWP